MADSRSLHSSPGRNDIELYQRSAGHQVLEVLGILGSVTAVVVLMWRCIEGIALVADEKADAVAVHVATFAAAIAGGTVLADFASGVVHFAFDRFFTVDTPLIGRHFVQPFRQHHCDPKEMTRHGFVETNGNNCLATCLPLLALLALPFDYQVGWQLFFVALVSTAAIGIFMTNQFHKWAHDDEPPRLVGWLQQRAIILPRRHHQVHHTWPYDVHYCITTGWSNALLLRLRFWPLLAWFCTRIMRLRLYTEATPWEQDPGSPACLDHEQMASINHG